VAFLWTIDRRRRVLFIFVVENTHKFAIRIRHNASCFTIAKLKNHAPIDAFRKCKAMLGARLEHIEDGTTVVNPTTRYLPTIYHGDCLLAAPEAFTAADCENSLMVALHGINHSDASSTNGDGSFFWINDRCGNLVLSLCYCWRIRLLSRGTASCYIFQLRKFKITRKLDHFGRC